MSSRDIAEEMRILEPRVLEVFLNRYLDPHYFSWNAHLSAGDHPLKLLYVSFWRARGVITWYLAPLGGDVYLENEASQEVWICCTSVILRTYLEAPHFGNLLLEFFFITSNSLQYIQSSYKCEKGPIINVFSTFSFNVLKILGPAAYWNSARPIPILLSTLEMQRTEIRMRVPSQHRAGFEYMIWAFEWLKAGKISTTDLWIALILC